VGLVGEVINILSTDEKDYSDYARHLSNIISILALFSGFMFTAYTILITRLPDPSTITAQLTLYAISTFLKIFLSSLMWTSLSVDLLCRKVPPSLKIMNPLFTKIMNMLLWASLLVGMVVITALMSLLWSLKYLAIIQIVQGTLIIVADYVFMLRPYRRYRKSRLSE